jgi:hypothetical protein
MFSRAKRILFAGALVIGLWSFQGLAQALGANENVTERIIGIEAEGDVLHYQETLRWNEGKWAEVLGNRSTYSSRQIEHFNKTYSVDANDFRIEFIEAKQSTLLTCDVHGKFNGNWYDFHWFLNPLELDFLDSPFTRTERSLSWKGSIEGTSTRIFLEFPFPVQNCHAHVWEK